MKAMVLAAGEGRRLRPVTDHLPKPMVPLGGHPLLEYTVRLLRQHGFDDLVINLHYYPDVIRRHFGDGSDFGVRIQYSEETELLGTAGAIGAVRSEFAQGTFLVLYGDNLSTCDLTRLVAFHRSKRAVVTMAVFHRDDVTQSGIVGLDSDDRVTRFLEKPNSSEVFSHWVNAGIIVAEPTLLEYIPDGTFSDLARDILPAALAEGQLHYGYRMTEGLWWADTLQEYRRLEDLMAKGELQL